MAKLIKKPKARTNGGGNYTPRVTVQAQVTGKDAITIGEDSVTVKAVLKSNALAGFSSDFPNGKEVTITVNPARVGAVKSQLEKIEKHIKSNTVMTFENCVIKDGSLETQWITNFTREMVKNGLEANVPMYDAFVKVNQKRTNNDRVFQTVDIHMVQHAAAIVGPGSENAGAMVKDIAAQLREGEGLMEDPSIAEWVGRADSFDSLDAFQRLGVIYDCYNYFAEFTTYAMGYDIGLRVIEMQEDLSKFESFDSAKIFGGSVKEPSPEDPEVMTYRNRTFAEAIESAFNRSGVKPDGVDDVTYEDIVNNGIEEALSAWGKENEDGDVVFGDAFTDRLVSYFSFLQDEDALSQENSENFMIEVIPTLRQGLGADTMESGDKIAEPFHPKAEPVTKDNGETFNPRHSVIGRADINLMARKDHDTDELIQSYFTSKVVPQVTFSNRDGSRFSYDAYTPSTLPTPNTDAVPAVKEALENLARETAKRYDPRNWGKDNSNSNDKDDAPAGGNDFEAEKNTPKM